MIKKIVLATGNPGKLQELRALLVDTGIELISQAEFGARPIEETGCGFRDNALLKARHAARISRLPAIADDSGLEVDALDGAPGVYSARYAGEGASDAANLEKLLIELRQVPAAKRTARFRCIVAFVRDAGDPAPIICEAVWDGRILEEPRGRNGFGYDPVFWAPELNRSAAELAPPDKNRLSHRGQALRKLVQQLARLEA